MVLMTVSTYLLSTLDHNHAAVSTVQYLDTDLDNTIHLDNFLKYIPTTLLVLLHRYNWESIAMDTEKT